MAGNALLRLLFVVSLAALVSACQGESSPFGQRQAPGLTEPAPAAGQPAAASTTKSVKLVDRDVEAPNVFSVTDMALWDGAPVRDFCVCTWAALWKGREG